jgi:hypothetical protein
MADGWSMASCLGTCIGAFFTLCSWFTSFLPTSLKAPLTEITALMRDILRTLRRIENLLRQLLEEIQERPPAREDPRVWEITMTGRAQPRLRHEVASASGQS